MVEKRPDIAFATLMVSHFTKNAGHQHTEVVKTILQYLKSFKKWGITYSSQEKLLVKGYSDSNWADGKESQNQLLISFLCSMEGL